MTTLTVWSAFLVALVAINITVREFLRCGKRFFLGGGLRFFRRCRLLFGRDQHNLSSSGLNLLLRGFSSNNNLGTLARHGELAFERSGTKGAHGGQCSRVGLLICNLPPPSIMTQDVNPVPVPDGAAVSARSLCVK